MKTHLIECFGSSQFRERMDKFLEDYIPEQIVDIEYAITKYGHDSYYSALIITKD
ncbi:MAG: hypothetical protein IJZ68_08370 [Bacteroidaceae bacterium]|nr:hypothetical protein [Bacteroidaceae bacterium]